MRSPRVSQYVDVVFANVACVGARMHGQAMRAGIQAGDPRARHVGFAAAA